MSHELGAHEVLSQDELDRLHADALELNPSYEFLGENNVVDLAERRIVAHGREMSIVEALKDCENFQRAIEGTVAALKGAGIEDKEMIKAGVVTSIERQSASAPATVETEAEKKSA